jgi:hypothetical protein
MYGQQYVVPLVQYSIHIQIRSEPIPEMPPAMLVKVVVVVVVVLFLLPWLIAEYGRKKTNLISLNGAKNICTTLGGARHSDMAIKCLAPRLLYQY